MSIGWCNQWAMVTRLAKKYLSRINIVWILVILSAQNLLVMHYYLFSCGYLEWTFQYSFIANLLSVCFDTLLILLVCLLFTRHRLKPALGLTFAISLLWSFVNIVYSRFFYTYLPLSGFGEIANLKDSLVIANMFGGLRLTDLYFLFLMLGFIWLYRKSPPQHFPKKSFLHIIVLILLSLAMTILSYSLYHFVHTTYH